MEIHYEDDALRELYEYGTTNKKQYKKLSKEVIYQYIKTINYLHVYKSIDEVRRRTIFRCERLRGDRRMQEALRINKQYRLIFTSDTTEEGLSKIDINLIEISKHYDE